MVKVLDPEGIIIGVYDSADEVPNKVFNRMCSYAYPKEECDIVEVTDEREQKRLLPSLEMTRSERRL